MSNLRIPSVVMCQAVLFTAFILLVPIHVEAQDDELTLRSVTVSNISSTYAVVSFFTDRPAIGEVKYGTDPENLNMTAGDYTRRWTGLVYIHLYDLQENTRYYFACYAYSNTSVALDDNDGKLYSFKTTMSSYTSTYLVTGSVMYIENGTYVPVDDAVAFFYVEHGEQRTLLQSNVTASYFGSFIFSMGNLKLPSGMGYDIQLGDRIVIEVDAGPLGTGKNTTVYKGGNVDMGIILVGTEGSGAGTGDENPPEESPGSSGVNTTWLFVLLVIAVMAIALALRTYSYFKKKGREDNAEGEE